MDEDVVHRPLGQAGRRVPVALQQVVLAPQLWPRLRIAYLRGRVPILLTVLSLLIIVYHKIQADRKMDNICHASTDCLHPAKIIRVTSMAWPLPAL